MDSTWKQLVNNMFDSSNVSGLHKRAFCTYSTLKDRIYAEVLPDVLKILHNEGVGAKSDIWVVVWGKLTSASIYVMIQTVLRYFEDNKDDADDFNLLVINAFLRDFNESKETLMEYGKDNPNLGRGQAVWALGSQICKTVGRRDVFLATKIVTFWEQITKIEAETTSGILRTPIDDVKKKMLKLNYVRVRKD